MVTVPVSWAGVLAISNARMLIYYSNKIHGSNFVKRHSETVVVRNYQNVDCSLREKIIVSFIIIFFGTLSFAVLAWTRLHFIDHADETA